MHVDNVLFGLYEPAMDLLDPSVTISFTEMRAGKPKHHAVVQRGRVDVHDRAKQPLALERAIIRASPIRVAVMRPDMDHASPCASRGRRQAQRTLGDGHPTLVSSSRPGFTATA